MIEKHLASIRSGEDQARSRIAEAEDKAVEIVERAREDGEKSLDDVLVKAAEEERSLLAAAGRKADEEITSIRTAEAKRIAALSVAAKRNRERALEIILGAFGRDR